MPSALRANRPAPAGPDANAVVKKIVEWGQDPYATEQANTFAAFDKATLEGNLGPDSIRYGAQDFSTADYAPQQAFPVNRGTAGPVPLGPNQALPATNAPAVQTSIRDLLEEHQL